MSLPSIPTPRRELVSAGASHDELDRQLRSGRALAPYRGVILDACVPLDLAARCRAALASQAADSAIGHETAAALLGLPWVPDDWRGPRATVHVVAQRDEQRRHRSRLRLHRALLPPDDVVEVAGIRCTSVARTLVDLARRADADRLLVVQLADGALRRHCTRDDLRRALRSAARLRNVARARDWFALVRDGVDSPRETELRLALLDGGVTGIDVDIRIHDEDGMVLARGDLGSRRLLLWAEYDGYETHTARQVFRSDRVGDRWLERRGWHVMRFVDEDLARPWRTVREWQAAADVAVSRIAAMDPRRSPEVAAARRSLGLDS